MPVLVGIVADHPVMLLGLTTVLNASGGIRVAATGATASQLVARLRRADVVLLDVALGDGTTPSENLRILVPLRSSVVAYASDHQTHLIRDAARGGAAGMISKCASTEVVAAAVRRAARGQAVATAAWAAALDSDRQFVTAHLSPRESQVLSLYASGKTAETVARSLYLSRETVLDHIRRIRAKYAAVNRAAPTKVDLFRRAVEDGLVLQDS